MEDATVGGQPLDEALRELPAEQQRALSQLYLLLVQVCAAPPGGGMCQHHHYLLTMLIAAEHNAWPQHPPAELAGRAARHC